MSISIQCDCGMGYRLKKEAMGKKVRCKCGKVLEVLRRMVSPVLTFALV